VMLVAGCGRHEQTRTPIARLDDETLTLEDIRSRLDTSQEPSQAQLQQFIRRWVRTEVLYREAKRRGLDRTEKIDQQLEDARRELAINALLDEEIYAQRAEDISQNEVQSYYDAHKDEFDLTNDVALVSYALFKNRDAATEFHNAVLKGRSWNLALRQLGGSIQAHADSLYYTQGTLVPIELWRVASNGPVRETSYPISTSQGYYILFVWKYSRQGQSPDLAYIEPDIRSRLLIEKRQKSYDAFLTLLRSKHSIQVFLTPGTDTSSVPVGE